MDRIDNLPKPLEYIISAAGRAPSADNGQPWQFVWDELALSLRIDRSRLRDSLFTPESPAILLAMGAAVENMVQATENLATTMRLEWPIDPLADDFFLRVKAEDWPSIPVPQQLWQHPLFQRCTNRWPYRPGPLPEDSVRWLDGVREEVATHQLLTERVPIERWASWVKLASRLRFRIQEVHRWFCDTLRWSDQEARRGEGLDLETLHLPPGGRAILRFTGDWRRVEWLNRLGLYKFFASVEAVPIASAPAILLITGEDNVKGAVAAGRLLERLWIGLNQRGLAVHPYYVIPDQLYRLDTAQMPVELLAEAQRLKDETAAELREMGRLYMMLRVGRPTAKVKRSYRLPMPAVTVRESQRDSDGI